MDETIRRSFCIAFQIGRRRRETGLVKEFMIVRVASVDKTMLPESTEFVSVSVTASIENVVIAFARFLIPRSACTDALIDVESRLSSAPVPGLRRARRSSSEPHRPASGRSSCTQSDADRISPEYPRPGSHLRCLLVRNFHVDFTRICLPAACFPVIMEARGEKE